MLELFSEFFNPKQAHTRDDIQFDDFTVTRQKRPNQRLYEIAESFLPLTSSSSLQLNNYQFLF